LIDMANESKPKLRGTLVSNTGLYLSYADKAILVDGLNGLAMSFYEIDPAVKSDIINGVNGFENIVGLFYTHSHEDHYSEQKNEDFLVKNRHVKTFVPSDATANHGKISLAGFQVEYQRMTHTPCDVPCANHFVFYITVGERTLYVTADADLNVEAHEEFLGGRQADFGFFNPMYLSYGETRQFITKAAKKVFIYHVPLAATDASGFSRKMERNFNRHPKDLENVTALTTYPMNIFEI